MTPADCAKWDAANPRVWRLFCRHAWAQWHAQERRGIPSERRRFSARYIIEKIRWDTPIATERGADPMGWRVNCHMAPHYAKRFLERYPNLDGYFQLRAKAEPRGHWAGLRDGPQRRLFGG